MNTEFRIPAGSTIRVGVPARPIPAEIRDQIGKELFSISEVIEAHLPMCHVPEIMKEPAQILVVVLERKTDPSLVVPAILKLVEATLPEGIHLDVWPLDARNSLIGVIRKANCQLFNRATQQKRWWELWK
jgi:hypothetical protein